MREILFLAILQTIARISALQGVNESLDVAPGYLLEEYFVQTSDGYILKLFRLSGSEKCPKAEGKPVVFLMHGSLCSASDWIVLGSENAIAYLLVDAGYDVWLGNARGTTFSRAHVSLLPESKEFWQFDLLQIGTIDSPAMIDFVLEETNQEALHYIGHSQGTTTFFIMCSELTDYNGKIITMQAFAPIVYTNHAASEPYKLLAPLASNLDKILKRMGLYDDDFLALILKAGGYDLTRSVKIMKFFLSIVFGFDSGKLDSTLSTKIFATYPSGGSLKQMVHFLQLHNSQDFRQFDYYKENLAKYGSTSPPKFDLTKVTAPVILHYADNDWMAAEKDVRRLAGALGNLVGFRRVPDDKFDHLGYIWAMEAKQLLYNSVLEIIAAN